MHHLVSDSITPTQNALRRPALVERLLRASSIQPGDLVLDLGAGPGVITRQLATYGCQVLAVEVDASLVARLRLACANLPNVEVQHADILQLRLPRRAYKVFANIPFNATAAIISRLVGAACPPEDAYLVVQREAFERFGGHNRTTLPSVLLYPWFEVSLVHAFQPTDFVPAPRVDVVMLRLRKRGPPLLSAAHAQLFRDFVVRLFTAGGASLGERLSEVLGKRRGRRLARRLGIADAPPRGVPPATWLALFAATLQVAADDVRWRVAHAEGHLRAQQHRLRKVHRTRARHLRPPPVRPGEYHSEKSSTSASRARVRK